MCIVYSIKIVYKMTQWDREEEQWKNADIVERAHRKARQMMKEEPKQKERYDRRKMKIVMMIGNDM